MAYRVRVSKTALADAESTYEELKAKYSDTIATKWYNGLVDAIQTLKEQPARCAYAPERDEIGRDIRQLLYGKRSAIYRIVFAVEADEALDEQVVRVFRIRHSSRDRLHAEDLEE